MAQDKTTILALIKDASGEFINSQSMDGLIVLDEGHSRPSWAFANSLSGSRAWVPEKPETILLDGLLMLAADLLREPSLRTLIEEQVEGSSHLVDLNQHPLSEDVRAHLPAAMTGFTVLIVALQGSHVLNLVHQLDSLGIAYRLATEHGH